jgi:hypothetical protein
MGNEFDDLRDLPDVAEPDDPDEDALETEFSRWHAQLPDFVWLDYPLDIPPSRLPAVRVLFDAIDAWRFCPEASCYRRRACRRGDGPPCFRADRKVLSKVLFITWLRLFWGLPDEEWARSFAFCAPRYAADDEPRAREHDGGTRRSGRRGAAKNGRRGLNAARKA